MKSIIAYNSEIKRYVWLQVALNIFFNSLGILTAGAMISLVSFGGGTVPLDLTITNLLLMFFVYTGGVGEMHKWRAKHGLPEYDAKPEDHKYSYKLSQMSPFKGYLVLLALTTVCVTLPMWGILISVYGDEIPQMHMLAYKEAYAVFVAYMSALLGSRAGAFSDIPKKLKAKMAKA